MCNFKRTLLTVIAMFICVAMAGHSFGEIYRYDLINFRPALEKDFPELADKGSDYISDWIVNTVVPSGDEELMLKVFELISNPPRSSATRGFTKALSAAGHLEVALAKLGSEGFLERIYSQLNSPVESIREESYILLAMIGDERALRTFGSHLQDDNYLLDEAGEAIDDPPAQMAATALYFHYKDRPGFPEGGTKNPIRFGWGSQRSESYRSWWAANREKLIEEVRAENESIRDLKLGDSASAEPVDTTAGAESENLARANRDSTKGDPNGSTPYFIGVGIALAFLIVIILYRRRA